MLIPHEKKYIILLFSLLLLTVFILVYLRSRKDNEQNSSENFQNKKANKILCIMCDNVIEEIDKDNYSIDFIEFSEDMNDIQMINKIANIVSKYYKQFDSFIIIRKNRKSFTASLLSFILENINKTVIICDSVSACIDFAEKSTIPEVCLYIDDKVYRGNQVKDDNIPLYPILAEKIDNEIIYYPEYILSRPKDKFKVLKMVEQNIDFIKMHPNINNINISSPIIIIEGYIDNQDILEKIKEQVEEKGIIAINTGESNNNIVEEYGIISTDTTPETAYAKVMMICSNIPNYNVDLVRQLFKINMRGEMIL